MVSSECMVRIALRRRECSMHDLTISSPIGMAHIVMKVWLPLRKRILRRR